MTSSIAGPGVIISEQRPVVVEPVRSVVEVITDNERVVSVIEPTPTSTRDLSGFATTVQLDSAIAGVQTQVTELSSEVAARLTAQAFAFVQSTSSPIWRVTHGLGFQPGGITVLDTSGDQVLGGDVQHLDVNTLQLTFARPVAGTVYLS